MILYATGANAGVILTGGGLTLVEEGPAAAVDGGPAPANLATGAAAFTSSDLGPELGIGFHLATNINDGAYGNSFSWIGGDTIATNVPFAAIDLGAVPVSNVQSIAFGRNNVVTGFTDRHLGLYTLQFTTVSNPDASLVTTGDDTTGWTDIGTLDYGLSDGAGTNYNKTWERHRYNFDPVSASGIRLVVPQTGLNGGTAIDEIELYDVAGAVVPPPPPPSPLTILPAAGFSATWDGNDGDHFDATPPPLGAIVPDNLALASNGATAFSSGDLGPELNIGFHVTTNINDGFYGNSNSWIGASNIAFAEPFVGVDLGGLFEIDRIAWGRDNGNGAFDDSTAGTDACGGQCDDRSLGTYELQFTTVANPDANTPDTGDSNTGWETISLFEYLFDSAAFNSFLRHEFEVSLAGGTQFSATGLRLLVPGTGLAGGTAIDEFEVYGQLISQQVPVPPTLSLIVLAGLLGVPARLRRRRLSE